MNCTICNEKHSLHRNDVACDYCGERCRATVRTHFGTGFGYNRAICAECIDAINDNNTDFAGNWKGYVLDRFGRSVALLCEEAREELARKIVLVISYGGGEKYSSDDEAIDFIEGIEDDPSIYVTVLGQWYHKNIVAVYGDGRIFLIVPRGIMNDALYSYADEVRIADAHANGELCGNDKCEICFG